MLINLVILLADNTPEKLFQFVCNKVGKLPTYKFFYQLLDNYIPQTGIPEEVDSHELKENQAFIKACLRTAPMIYTYNYLKKKNVFHGDFANFEKRLHEIWFDLYKREGNDDSSAFEHVFVGEVRDGVATGNALLQLIRLKFWLFSRRARFIGGRGPIYRALDPIYRVLGVRLFCQHPLSRPHLIWL